MNSLCTTLLLAASLFHVPKQATVQGITQSLEIQHDAEAIIVTLRTAVRGRSHFLFNPQYIEYLGVPGRLDVYNQRGEYLGDILPTIDPFGKVKRLSAQDWLYLHDSGAVESQIQIPLADVRVFRNPRHFRVVPGEESVPLNPSETYTCQLVADERILSTPSVMDRFQRGSNEERKWQRGELGHKVLIRSKPVEFTLPPSRNVTN